MGVIVKTIEPEARNYLINGNFDFWQRGVGPVIPVNSNNTFLADRWKLFRSSTGAVTLSQDTDVPTKAQAGFQSKFSQKIACSTAEPSIVSGDFMVFRQPVEGLIAQEFIGRKATLSFWVKCSYAGNFCAVIATGGSTLAEYVVDYTVNAANTWEKKALIIDFTTSLSGYFNLDNTLGFNVDFPLAMGPDRVTATKNAWITPSTSVQSSNTASNFLSSTSNIMWLSQVSLTPALVDPGSFQRSGRNMQQEFAACERYYKILGAQGGNGTNIRMAGTGSSTNQIRWCVEDAADMRTTSCSLRNVNGNITVQRYDAVLPTVTVSGAHAGGANTISVTLVNKNWTTSITSSGVDGAVYQIANASNSYCELDAEL